MHNFFPCFKLRGGGANVRTSHTLRHMFPSRLPPMFTRRSAFSLIEILAVMAILTTLSVVTIPAIQSLRSAGSVDHAISDLFGTFEMARAHAMASRTYVRVLLTSLPASGGRTSPSTVALVIYSADGTIRNTDMSDTAAWPALSRPLVLDNLGITGAVQGAGNYSTAGDATPAGSNVTGSMMSPFQRQVSSGLGKITFDQVIQFGPNGEARVGFDQPARHISLALARAGLNGQISSTANAFILRVSGANGSIAVLRDDKITH